VQPDFTSLKFKPSPPSLSSVLVAELQDWYSNLEDYGLGLRSFTGITREGVQCVTPLTGIGMGGQQGREFLIWLIREERFVAYAYAFPAGTYDEATKTLRDTLLINASCEEETVCLGLTLVTRDDLRVYRPTGRSVNPGWQPYMRLQFSDDKIDAESSALFANIWAQLRPHAMFRERNRK
jgi:hypothetical protein